MKSGVTKIKFPVIAGSGYKIFINTVSETTTETEPLKMYIANTSAFAKLPYPFLPRPMPIRDIDYNTDQLYTVEYANVSNTNTFGYSSPGLINTHSVNVQIPEGIEELTMYFEANNPRLSNTTYAPNSVRLFSISGVSLPVSTLYNTTSYINTEVISDGFDIVLVAEAVPERTFTIPPVLRPILTDNSKYCDSVCSTNFANQLIADGPVVAAQEVESITSFNAGNSRSRITLLSDSSFVQGSCMVDGDIIPENTVNFLRSLYPASPANTNSGRQFNTTTKIVSPERGSPQKYYAVSGNVGNNLLFNTPSPAQSLLSSFDDKESKYDPRYVGRLENPYKDNMPSEEIERIKNREIATFVTLQNTYGSTAKFSGIIEGNMYEDASFAGGMPQLMKEKGYDYLDLHRFPSGYPGDLFGYSIDLHRNKLIIGSPFSAFSNETIKPWTYYIDGGSPSGMELGYNGGAGSVYIFEKTYNGSGLLGSKTPWEFTRKLRPDSIIAGSGNSGNNIVSDQFG
jgi:hypothetical protein